MVILGRGNRRAYAKKKKGKVHGYVGVYLFFVFK